MRFPFFRIRVNKRNFGVLILVLAFIFIGVSKLLGKTLTRLLLYIGISFVFVLFWVVVS